MTVELTKKAKRLLKILLKQYKLKINDKQSIDEAKYIGSSEYVYKNIFAEYSYEDLDDLFRELHRAGYVECFYADDVVIESCLTDQAIVYMENRFKVKTVLNIIIDFICKIISIIPLFK